MRLKVYFPNRIYAYVIMPAILPLCLSMAAAEKEGLLPVDVPLFQRLGVVSLANDQ